MANWDQLMVDTPEMDTTKNSDKASATRRRTPSGEDMICCQAM